MAVHDDSRRVQPGDTFVACAADPDERARHIADARERGAARILSTGGENGCERVAHARWSYARLHAQAAGLELLAPVLGVTGTDGKTSVVHLAHHLLGPGAARIGTLGWFDGTGERPSSHTTPPADQIHDFLSGLPDGCPGICIELSSHGLDQYRPAALGLSGLVWTGVGRDHLDYHGSEEAYVAAKLGALRMLLPEAVVVIRAEDARAHVVEHGARAMGATVVRLGFHSGDVRLHHNDDGSWLLRSAFIECPLPVPMPGDHNAWNAAAAALLVRGAGVGLDTALERLASAPQVPGRLELVNERPWVYVDYAHTPLALEMALRALRSSHPHRKLVCVFGAGGDRDPGKRAPMGRAVARHADLAVVTNDNPRSEVPSAIAQAICGTVPVAADPDNWNGDHPFFVELDRGRAIRLALRTAGDEGLVLVAGKGHEQVQIIGDERLPWDDAAAIRRILGERR